MKLINRYKIVLCLSLLFGCTKDFEEVNTNPNGPEKVPANLLLPGIQRDMMRSLMSETWTLGNVVMQHTAKNQFVNEDRYLWGEKNNIWNAVYHNVRDVNNILLLAEEDENLSNYRAVALVMKSWMFSLATDAYGDVPYSQTMHGKDGVFFPVYDTQEAIYTGILADLAEANTTLATATNIADELIYGGNVASWRKLANSLRIRYLMRISDRIDVADELQAIVSDPDTNPIFAGNEEHAVYTYLASSPDQFPLFSERIGSFNEYRASKTMTDKLLALDDPRLYIYSRPTPLTEETPSTADDEYVGIPNGMDDVGAQEYNGGQENQSRIGSLFYENATTPEGLSIAKGVIMTYAELQFILAEAREKGLITVGDAATYYTQAITASFNYYGLEPEAAYLAQADVAYTGTTDEKLEKIGNQKWISLYYQGFEAWFDWKRTGYPVLLPSLTNQNDDRIPVRLIYPISEQSLNGDNRAAAVTRQGADDINSHVWWDVE